MRFVPVAGTSVQFSIGETRVQDYAAFATAVSGVDASWKSPGFIQDGTHPAVNVSWENAKKFVAWLTEQERKEGKLTSQQSYRLPTDGEWSYMMGIGDRESGGTPQEKDAKLKNVYPWGTHFPPPRGAGKHGFALRTDDFDHTSPVGSVAAGASGLFDLGGNVWEWCEDYYNGFNGARVLRGASWNNNDPDNLVSSNRTNNTPDKRNINIGFRCVLAGASARRCWR